MPHTPNNPPRCRRPGESTQQYRIAMGWDTPPAVIAPLALLSAQAFDIADRAVIADLEGEAHREQRDGQAWFDTRPMTDRNEHAPEVIDMAGQALAYARLRGLVLAHATLPHLVRVVRRP